MNTTPDPRIGHIIAEETVQTVLLIIVSVVGTRRLKALPVPLP